MAASDPNARLWPARKIPFVLPDSQSNRAQILAAMAEIEGKTGLWFCRRGNEPNYLTFTDDESQRNNAYLGMQPGANAMNLKGDAWWALHEICHALGLVHEQCRPDSQTYIETFFRTPVPIALGCVPLPARPNGVVDPNDGDMAVDCSYEALTAYDRLSVMHYPTDMGLITGAAKPSMAWRADPSLPLGADDRRTLSALDVEGLRRLYASASGWGAQSRVDGVATRSSPALAAFGNRLYAAWNGYHDDGIFWASSDGTSWSGQQRLDVGTRCGPALAAYDGRLYAAWNGYHDDGIFYASYDGSNWSGQQRLDVGTRTSPALAAFGGRLYAAWNGYHNDGIYFASYDGSNWSGQGRIEGVLTQTAPALAAHGGRLYAAWNGYHDDGLYFASYDGSNWSGQARVSDYGTTKGPALASFFDPYDKKSALFLTWAGAGDDGVWWANSDAAVSNWSGQARSKFGTSAGPALATFGGKLWLIWCGSGGDGLWYASFSV